MKKNNFDGINKIASNCWQILTGIGYTFREIFNGLWQNIIPFETVGIFTIVISLFWIFKVDVWMFPIFREWFYHKAFLFQNPMGIWRVIVSFTTAFFPIFLWGAVRAILRFKFEKELAKAFKNSGLQSKSEELPHFISDTVIDRHTRVLRLDSNGMEFSAFQRASESLMSSFNAFITEVKLDENYPRIVEIVYSDRALPKVYELRDVFAFKPFEFPIGQSRSGLITANLKDIPHFLVAGASGGGKSTFLKSVIATLISGTKNIRIDVLDPKGGGDFSEVALLPRVSVFSTPEETLKKVQGYLTLIETRKELFRPHRGVEKIDVYNQKIEQGEIQGTILERKLLIVDEVSEYSPKLARKKDKVIDEISLGINKLCRLGRSSGIHVMVATQKPDAINIDPTIKANMSGIICFPVNGPHQSMVVLGNTRATNLPKEKPGRVIWQLGSTQEEVQCPILAKEVLEKIKLTHGKLNQITEEEIPGDENGESNKSSDSKAEEKNKTEKSSSILEN
jgi:hypothetical protein